jgi:hypothetical protein
MTTDDGATVRSLLEAVGVAPPDDEVEDMIQGYPSLRAAADSLYAPEASRFIPSFLTNDAESSSSNLESK